jgi:Glyoxalase/Bleomycin resistance protein/Dioxygenase superfamily
VWLGLRRQVVIFSFNATQENKMSNVAMMPPRVNGILETSLYVESPARSAEFYRRILGFEPLEPGEPLNDETRLCPMRAGDRSVLLLFKKKALRLIRTPSAQFTSRSGSLVVICLLGNAG